LNPTNEELKAENAHPFLTSYYLKGVELELGNKGDIWILLGAHLD
jgi:hypothetical protein